MVTRAPRPPRRLARALAPMIGAALLALTGASSALAASSFGELTRFGQLGNGAGQVSGEERRALEEPRAHLIGVDPVGFDAGDKNSVYVLDEPHEYEQEHKKPTPEEEEECIVEEIPLSECGPLTGPVHRHFRLQKFSASEGTYHFVASAEVEEQAPFATNTPSRLDVEGIAVDPARKRVYFLAVDARALKDKVDKETRDGRALPVATALYAFSTEQKGTALVPAGKEGKNKEILTGAGAGGFESQTETPGKALLEPGGITVDPETGEIIVIAHEDPSGAAADQLYDNKEKPSPDHYVLQRIRATGELVTGESGRYVDAANFFKESELIKELPSYKPPAPNSPVVVGPAKAEQIVVAYERGLASVPYGFKGAPEYRYQPPKQLGATEGHIGLSLDGGALSAAPAGEGSAMYAPTVVENEQPNVGGTPKGLMELPLASPATFSYAGGQSLLAPRGAGEGHQECVLEPGTNELFAPVAAGSEGDVFVLANEFVDLFAGEKLYEGPFFPAVVELGPGGHGCPPAEAAGLAGEINRELVGSRAVTLTEQVTFSSYVNQGDAQKVEWDFGDGTSETVSGQFACSEAVVPPPDREFERNVRQCPFARHTFVKSGALTVTEKVYTDNLTTPVVTQETHINVVGELLPTAVLIGPREVQPGEIAIFDGSLSTDPAGSNQIRSYHFVFGDGSEDTTSEPVVEHVYASPGEYIASLTVTDAGGATSAPATLPGAVIVAVRPPTSKSTGEESQLAVSQQPASTGGSTSHPPPPLPDVTIASASLAASSSGALPLSLYCPADEATCATVITLRGSVAGVAHRGKRRRATVLTLARGTFTLAGGVRTRVVLHLSTRARAQLARSRSMVALLTIVARDPAGTSYTRQTSVILRAASSSKGHRSHGH